MSHDTTHSSVWVWDAGYHMAVWSMFAVMSYAEELVVFQLSS